MSRVTIQGAGPAGSAAALSALSCGAEVDIIEKSRFPRHKVCGEFLSPEIQIVLERLRVFGQFRAEDPARISRMILHFGSKSIASGLPEPGFGLSRYAFDAMVCGAAVRRGAVLLNEPRAQTTPDIVATGRTSAAPKGNRLFGFKAHFEGAHDDAVELFFFGDCYVGLNTVERGITNVCGLAPERILRQFDFDIDPLLATCAPLRDRLAPVTRTMAWMHVGPLVFENQLNSAATSGPYRCGDAISFVDPFTGSGILSGLLTGEIAGRYAAQALPVREYLAECRRKLHKPFVVSSFFRTVARQRWAGHLASAVPGRLLFRWTRPGSDFTVA